MRGGARPENTLSIRDIDGFHLLVQQHAPVRTRMYVCMYMCVHLRVSR